MPFTVTLPKLSPTMESGTIAKWHKKEGDFCKEGELLIEVATDKATIEYNVLDSGYLRKILVAERGEALVNQAIAIFTLSKEESIEGYSPEGVVKIVEKPAAEVAKSAEKVAAAPAKVESAVRAEPAFVPYAPIEGYSFEFPTGMQNERILASPAAKQLASQKNIDLSTIKGSGPNGRIVLEDIEGVQGSVASFHSRKLPQVSPGSYEEEPLSPMRKTIGRRLQESKAFIPHFYVSDEIIVDDLVKIREQLKSFGILVTYNDLVTRAVALALKQHPQINTGYNNQTHSAIHFKTIDISIAVSVKGGLITPIIRHADYKNVSQISQEVKELAKLAKSQKLKPEQYQGGSFTISNLGMYGIRDFLPIINPPQGAILGVGGIVDKAVVVDGKVVAGKTLSLSIAADHRIIDGADAAAFLVTLKKLLSSPSILII